MASDEKQRLAFEYLVGKFNGQQVFEKASQHIWLVESAAE
jgi:hypothetical protein